MSQSILHTLEEQHDEVAALLEAIANSAPRQALHTRMQLYPRLKNALLALGRAEDRTLYSALREHDATREDADAAAEAYRHVEALITRLDSLDYEDAAWHRTFEALMEAVEDHVDEEEGDLFDDAEDVLGTSALEELGDAFVRVRREELERLRHHA